MAESAVFMFAALLITTRCIFILRTVVMAVSAVSMRGAGLLSGHFRRVALVRSAAEQHVQEHGDGSEAGYEGAHSERSVNAILSLDAGSVNAALQCF